MFDFFKKQNKTVSLKVELSEPLSKEELDRLKMREQETELLRKNNEKYFKYTKESLEIAEEIWSSNLYSKAINSDNIFNHYADRYIELCDRLLEILPYNIEHDKEDAKIRNQQFRIRPCGNHITNYIRLLEKQEKYDKIIEVCNYLLSSGITEDGTKNGIKGRIEKANNNRDFLQNCK